MLEFQSPVLPADSIDGIQVELATTAHLPVPLPACRQLGQQHPLLQRLGQVNIAAGQLSEGCLLRRADVREEGVFDDVAHHHGTKRP